MKRPWNILVAAVLLLVAPSPCFALWVRVSVSKEKAKDIGMDVRLQADGPNHVRVELEFKTEGAFSEFSPEGRYKEYSRVELWIGQRDNARLTTELRENRSKAGRVVVGFTVDRPLLEQSQLRIMVPTGDGGIEYRIQVKDFVEPKEGP